MKATSDHVHTRHVRAHGSVLSSSIVSLGPPRGPRRRARDHRKATQPALCLRSLPSNSERRDGCAVTTSLSNPSLQEPQQPNERTHHRGHRIYRDPPDRLAGRRGILRVGAVARRRTGPAPAPPPRASRPVAAGPGRPSGRYLRRNRRGGPPRRRAVADRTPHRRSNAAAGGNAARGAAEPDRRADRVREQAEDPRRGRRRRVLRRPRRRRHRRGAGAGRQPAVPRTGGVRAGGHGRRAAGSEGRGRPGPGS